jgi:hypothetical protein
MSCSECPILLAWLELILLRMQSLERCFAVGGKIWPAHGCYGAGEESWFPLLVSSLSLGSLLSLLLLDIRLEVRCMRVLSSDYGLCDFVPEFERLVGKLLLERRNNLRDGIERVEVDDQVLLLLRDQHCALPYGS